MPRSAAPPVSARAKEPGSGATLDPGFDVLVPFARLNELTAIQLRDGVTVTLIFEDELLM